MLAIRLYSLVIFSWAVIGPFGSFAQEQKESLSKRPSFVEVRIFARGAQVEPLASEIHRRVGGNGTSILIDFESNEVVVRAPAEQVERVRSRLGSLKPKQFVVDRKARWELRAYSDLNGQNPENLASELQSKYAEVQAFASESPTRSEVVVAASSETHASLKSSKLEPAKLASAIEFQVSAAQEVSNTQLRGLSPDSVLGEFRRFAKGPIEVHKGNDSTHFSAFVPTNQDGSKVQLDFDSKRKSMRVVGRPKDIRFVQFVVSALQDQAEGGDDQTEVIPLDRLTPEQLSDLLERLRSATRRAQAGANSQTDSNETPEEMPEPDDPAPPENPLPRDAQSELNGIGSVQIEVLDDQSILLKGRTKDVARLKKLIEEIERQSEAGVPDFDIVPLANVDSQALSELLTPLYEQNFGARRGRISMTPLAIPNALLLIGRRENIDQLKELINKLDQPLSPDGTFRVFQLKHISASDAEQAVRALLVQRPGFGTEPRTGLGTRAGVIAAPWINSIIVRGSPRELVDIEQLLKKIDIDKVDSVDEIRVFRLRYQRAEDLVPVLQEAILGRRTSGSGASSGGSQSSESSQRRAALQLLQVDDAGQRLLQSGLLANVRVTADERGNSVVVRGPSANMNLIGELIDQLDQLPSGEAQIKVFTMTNADAQNLQQTLQSLFGGATGGQGGGGQSAQRGAGINDTLIPLRFALDARTNSVVVTGSANDLEIVERVIVRLDEGDVRRRRTRVFRLRNAPAQDVSTAINQFLQSQRQVNQLAQGVTGAGDQIEREVVVVAEVVSNALLVSATPRYFEEIQRIVDDLDRRPPMVVIQVLIAEVTLDDFSEFGAELGLQDSLLFDRGIGSVGFPFNNLPLGNSTAAASIATRNNVGAQGLSNFSLGRTNSDLLYGGMVLSASSDSVNVLIRALQTSRRLQVISRPQVQTLDNQPAYVQVGARVPYVTGITQNLQGGITSQTQFQNVGILLGVTPRTSPDGLIVMEIDAEKSELGPDSTGIPIFVSATGTAVRAPQILITTAQTTVSARTGQTVILGGLITKTRTNETRRVPYVSDIPVVGRLFRFDRTTEQKRELLLIMTPYIVRSDEDIDFINTREAERMHWCLADIADVHGELPWIRSEGPWNQKTTPTIVPDEDPTGTKAEAVPARTPTDATSPSRSSRDPVPDGWLPGPNAPIPPPPSEAGAVDDFQPFNPNDFNSNAPDEEENPNGSAPIRSGARRLAPMALSKANARNAAKSNTPNRSTEPLRRERSRFRFPDESTSKTR